MKSLEKGSINGDKSQALRQLSQASVKPNILIITALFFFVFFFGQHSNNFIVLFSVKYIPPSKYYNYNHPKGWKQRHYRFYPEQRTRFLLRVGPKMHEIEH